MKLIAFGINILESHDVNACSLKVFELIKCKGWLPGKDRMKSQNKSG